MLPSSLSSPKATTVVPTSRSSKLPSSDSVTVVSAVVSTVVVVDDPDGSSDSTVMVDPSMAVIVPRAPRPNPASPPPGNPSVWPVLTVPAAASSVPVSSPEPPRKMPAATAMTATTAPAISQERQVGVAGPSTASAGGIGSGVLSLFDMPRPSPRSLRVLCERPQSCLDSSPDVVGAAG